MVESGRNIAIDELHPYTLFLRNTIVWNKLSGTSCSLYPYHLTCVVCFIILPSVQVFSTGEYTYVYTTMNAYHNDKELKVYEHTYIHVIKYTFNKNVSAFWSLVLSSKYFLYISFSSSVGWNLHAMDTNGYQYTCMYMYIVTRHFISTIFNLDYSKCVSWILYHNNKVSTTHTSSQSTYAATGCLVNYTIIVTS